MECPGPLNLPRETHHLCHNWIAYVRRPSKMNAGCVVHKKIFLPIIIIAMTTILTILLHCSVPTHKSPRIKMSTTTTSYITTTTCTTTATDTTTGTNTCAISAIYNIPTNDAACAISTGGPYSSILSQCCNNAPITTFDSNCALYCLAQGQSVGDLLRCMDDKGVPDGDRYCNRALTATASATTTGTETNTGTTTTNSATTTSSSSAGLSVKRDAVKKSGVGVVVFVVVGLLAGGLF